MKDKKKASVKQGKSYYAINDQGLPVFGSGKGPKFSKDKKVVKKSKSSCSGF